jgi:hypothetical protein
MVGERLDPRRPGPSVVFDPIALSTEPTGPQAIPRAGAHLVSLQDGRVLMFGGTPPHADGDEVGSIKQAEVFDPTTNTWKLTGALHTDRISADTTTLPDGRILVRTGYVPADLPVNVAGGGVAAETDDPSTGRWTRVFALDAVSPHVDLGAPISLGDGRVAFASGSRLQVWDSGSNTFGNDIQLPGDVAHQVALADGRIYLVGAVDKFTTWSGTFEPRTGELRIAGSTRAWGPAPVLLDDGRVLLVGGTTDGDAVLGMSPDHRIPQPVATMEYFRSYSSKMSSRGPAAEPDPAVLPLRQLAVPMRVKATRGGPVWAIAARKSAVAVHEPRPWKSA